MAAKKQHWIVGYGYRRHGNAEWDFANTSHSGPLAGWFKNMAQYTDGEYRLLFAHPCSSSEAKWLRDNL